MGDKSNNEKKVQQIPWWVKSIVLIAFTGVFSYKIIQTPMNLQFDFPSFLSLLLALFSVGLAAMFYFKATDTSNTFYDNTYKFTRDIAELLVRIESGFGEKLKHLDEAYKGMQDRFDQLPSRLQVKDAKMEVKKEEKELEKIIKEKEELIQELVSKAQLRDEEKQKFLNALKEKEEALNDARNELRFLKRRLVMAERAKMRNDDEIIIDPELRSFIRGPILHMLEPEYIAQKPTNFIQRRFNRIKEDLPNEILHSMRKYDLIDSEGDLTTKGASLLRDYARKYI